MPMIRDTHIEWKRKRVFLPAVEGGGIIATSPVGLHTGAPVYAEMHNTGVGAIKFEAAGDEFVHLWPIPSDCDVDNDIYARTVYTTDETGDGVTVDFILTYHDITNDETLAAADTALDTVIANDTTDRGAPMALYKTAWGIIDSAKVIAEDFLVLETEINAFTPIAATFIWYLGLEIEYTPRKTAGADTLQEATPNADS